MQDLQPLVLAGHRHPVYTLSAPADDSFLFSAGADQVLVMWHTDHNNDGTVIARTGSSIYALYMSPQQPLAWLGTAAGEVHLVDTAQKSHIGTWQIPGEPVFDLHPADNYLLASTARGTVVWLDAHTLTEEHRMIYDEGKIRKIAPHPEEPIAALACSDGKIRIIDHASGHILYIWNAHSDAVTSLAWLSGKFLLSGGKDAHLKCWDRTSGYAEIQDIPAHNYAIYGIDTYPEQKIFATCSRDKTAKIWNADTFEVLRRLGPPTVKGHSHSVNAMCWITAINALATTGDDGKILVWKKYI